MPTFPDGVITSYTDGPFGLMRSRAVGRPQPGVPEVVVVQGMAVASYLLPGVGALAGWTRAHLLELPGLAGSGDPPHELSVPEYGRAVAGWLTATRAEPVLLAGHSSGTQVAAEAAAGHPLVAGLMLASPTVDPAVRPFPRLALRFLQDGRIEPPGLTRTHLPEWRRAGPRRLAHLVRACLRHDIERALRRLTVSLLVLRGADDVLSTPVWARRLVATAPEGHYEEVPGAHGFPWLDPTSWSEPARKFSGDL
ncbi:alpha/beta fold hydrolase [Actinoplanes sp. NPDC051633]|uniref:alpha/beta fold hydrolase n=1 Tax=Actinoplanes sp. NPDC051633 TaxID=3155670 RepID=UPI00342A5FEB